MRKYSIKNIIRALRLPFVTASALPFIFGSVIDRSHFNPVLFFLGLTVALSTHLGANLLNDAADSASGIDWQDKKFYGFFGGSKLIQEGVFTERYYLRLAVSFAAIASLASLAIALIMKSVFVPCAFAGIILLSWAYSAGPFALSYNRMGEVTVFILFGPILVMGGYFLQTGIFPDVKSFALSLPFGFLTTAILYANEIPDSPEDEKAGKRTLAGAMGNKRAYILYYALVIAAFAAIIMNVSIGYMKEASLVSLSAAILGVKAAGILKDDHDNKEAMIRSSRLTIALQNLVGLALIGAALL